MYVALTDVVLIVIVSILVAILPARSLPRSLSTSQASTCRDIEINAVLESYLLDQCNVTRHQYCNSQTPSPFAKVTDDHFSLQSFSFLLISRTGLRRGGCDSHPEEEECAETTSIVAFSTTC